MTNDLNAIVCFTTSVCAFSVPAQFAISSALTVDRDAEATFYFEGPLSLPGSTLRLSVGWGMCFRHVVRTDGLTLRSEVLQY